MVATASWSSRLGVVTFTCFTVVVVYSSQNLWSVLYSTLRFQDFYCIDSLLSVISKLKGGHAFRHSDKPAEVGIPLIVHTDSYLWLIKYYQYPDISSRFYKRVLIMIVVICLYLNQYIYSQISEVNSLEFL